MVKFLADQPFTISQNVTVTDKTKPVSGYLTYMACDALKCLTPTDVEFSFSMDGGANATAAAVNTGAISDWDRYG